MTRTELIQAVSAISRKLSIELSAGEVSEGWAEPTRVHFLELFQKLESDLRSGADLPHLPIARNLDHWGIHSGELCREACEINNALNSRQE